MQATTAAFAEARRWPYTAAGRTAQAAAAADEATCTVEPIPFLAMLNELRTIDIGTEAIVIRFDNSGDEGLRVVHLDAAHPADVEPSRFGHSIGR